MRAVISPLQLANIHSYIEMKWSQIAI